MPRVIATPADIALAQAIWNAAVPSMVWPGGVGTIFVAGELADPLATGYINDQNNAILLTRLSTVRVGDDIWRPVAADHPLLGQPCTQLYLWATNPARARALFIFWFQDQVAKGKQYAMGWVYRSIPPGLVNRLDTWPFVRADYTTPHGNVSMYTADMPAVLALL